MNTGQIATQQHLLRPKTIGERPAMVIGDNQGVLVKVNLDAEGGYELVPTIDKPLSHEDLFDNYGVWNDQSTGMLWWKKDPDNRIQSDEVTPMKDLYPGQRWVIFCPSGSPFPGNHAGCALEDQWELRKETATIAFKEGADGPQPVLLATTECLKTQPYF